MGYQYRGNDFTIDDYDEPYYEPGSCGTYAGYRTHARNKTTPCDICKAANRDYNREWYARNKAGYSTEPVAAPPAPKPLPARSLWAVCGSRAGYIRHRNTKEEPCDECRAANTAYGIAYRKTHKRKSRAA